MGVVPVHAVWLAAEHWPQLPSGLHAGVDAPQCASIAQGTQTPKATLQSGVVPPQAVSLVAEHWPQLPSGWQAGVAPPH